MTVKVQNKVYLVAGNANGTVRFYDDQFKAEAWFEDQNLSKIKSISFSRREAKGATHLEKEQGHSTFRCPDFIVADENAMVVQLEAKIFEAIDKNDKKGTTLMLGIQSSIIALAVHPKKDIVAIAGDKGWIMLWDYVRKDAFPGQSYENYSKESRDNKGKEKGKKDVSYTCMEFTPDGEQLLVATTEGRIRIFDPDTAKEID